MKEPRNDTAEKPGAPQAPAANEDGPTKARRKARAIATQAVCMAEALLAFSAGFIAGSPAQAAFALPSGSPLDVAMPLCATIGAGMLTAAATRRLHGNRATDEARREGDAIARPREHAPRPESKPCDPVAMLARLIDEELASIGIDGEDRDVAACIMRGESYREISERIFYSENAIKYHAKRVYEKAQVGSRHEFEMLIRGNVEERIRRETEAQNETEESRGTEDRREQATARGAE